MAQARWLDFSGAPRFGTLATRGAAWGLVLCLLMSGRPLAPAAAAEAAPRRFLIILENSRVMQRRTEAVLRVTRQLLDTAFSGQLRPGDQLEMWTFNESVNTAALPVAEWTTASRPSLSVRVLDLIRRLPYQKRPSLGWVVPELNRVIRESPWVTVILVGSGESELHGTSVDEAVNEACRQWRAEQQKARMPIVTLLRARQGNISDWSVTPAPWPLQLPPLHPESIAASSVPSSPAAAPASARATPVQALATNPPATTSLSASTQTNPPAPVPAPLVIAGRKPEAPAVSALSEATPPGVTNATTRRSTAPLTPGAAPPPPAATNPVAFVAALPGPATQPGPPSPPPTNRVVAEIESRSPSAPPPKPAPHPVAAAPQPQPEPQAKLVPGLSVPVAATSAAPAATVALSPPAAPDPRPVDPPEMSPHERSSAATPAAAPLVRFDPLTAPAALQSNPLDTAAAPTPPAVPPLVPLIPPQVSRPPAVEAAAPPAPTLPAVESPASQPWFSSWSVSYLRENGMWLILLVLAAALSAYCFWRWVRAQFVRPALDISFLPEPGSRKRLAPPSKPAPPVAAGATDAAAAAAAPSSGPAPAAQPASSASKS